MAPTSAPAAAGAAQDLLRALGAAGMPHPGGTLLEHLVRVRELLAAWGADDDVQLAGLCHAAYGTDGFGPFLLETAERGRLAEVVGERAESLVYLYGSCDRSAVYPRLGADGPPLFLDRFTGVESVPADADLRAFAEITAANEFDVFAHNAELAARSGRKLLGLLSRVRGSLSPAAWDAWSRAPFSSGGAPTSGDAPGSAAPARARRDG